MLNTILQEEIVPELYGPGTLRRTLGVDVRMICKVKNCMAERYWFDNLMCPGHRYMWRRVCKVFHIMPDDKPEDIDFMLNKFIAGGFN